jgi:hypothetical protein
MKTPSLIQKISAGAALAAACLFATPAQGVNYAGNGNHGANGDGGFNGAVGNGVLSVTDDRTNLTVNLQRGSSGNLDDLLVIYIDTGTGTATNTAGFTDTGSNPGPGYEQKAISGIDGFGNRSVLIFTNGFKPGYAIAIKNDFMDLWSLANPASFSFLAGVSEGGAGSGNFSLTFNCAKLGLATNVPATIKVFGTYISASGYRSSEAIAGNIVMTSFGNGWHQFTNTAYATYPFAPAVVPKYAVKFSVDMKAQVNLGNFNPGTDLVFCGGSFQTNPFAFSDFPLVRSNGTTIYTNTYQDANLTNTVETYKFQYTSNGTAYYDADPNRSFTLKSGGQVVPLVYFDNIPAFPSATTNYIKFIIDMGPQIYLGHFSPVAGDLVKVYGSFESNKWSGNFPPIGYLTNNPTLSGNASNIYSGTFADGNYPGTVNQYKFLIAPGGTGGSLEDGTDRTLVTPTGTTNLPTAFYNGVNTYASNAITFRVDMTVPVLTRALDLARGDTVGCAGTFQTNSFGVGAFGFTLTNNPALSGLASNIYSGTYVDRNLPGSIERYKFVINTNAGDTRFELPASTGGGDRIFQLPNAAATNALVYWNDYSANEVLLVDTTVKFTVDMTNAVDRFGNPFDPDLDIVLVDGDFFQPQWNVMSHYNDLTLYGDYAGGHIMDRVGSTSTTYTNSFLVPAGNPVHVLYKYGIIHNNDGVSNTNANNEAIDGLDHTRYIRSLGNTNLFPMDTFGQQRTDLAGATEPAFGQLAIGGKSAGKFPVTWLGRRGVHLQSNTNLAGGTWQDLNATDGTSSTNWPATTGARYFRLVQP